MLCTPDEQYKRFISGVGMPTLSQFYGTETAGSAGDIFFAWPGTTHVSLTTMREIHKRAMSRDKLVGYSQFNSVLAMAAQKLGPEGGYFRAESDEGQMRSDTIRQILLRLPKQIKVLTNV
jgi:hypothetical protein